MGARLGLVGATAGATLPKGSNGWDGDGIGRADFDAFDKETGAELWRRGNAVCDERNPMTYRTESGRQIVVIATGGGAGRIRAAGGVRTRSQPRLQAAWQTSEGTRGPMV